MKRFALLRLQHNANTTLGEVNAVNAQDAAKQFNLQLIAMRLDIDGYAKAGDISFCVAECFDPMASVHEILYKLQS